MALIEVPVVCMEACSGGYCLLSFLPFQSTSPGDGGRLGFSLNRLVT